MEYSYRRHRIITNKFGEIINVKGAMKFSFLFDLIGKVCEIKENSTGVYRWYLLYLNRRGVTCLYKLSGHFHTVRDAHQFTKFFIPISEEVEIEDAITLFNLGGG